MPEHTWRNNVYFTYFNIDQEVSDMPVMNTAQHTEARSTEQWAALGFSPERAAAAILAGRGAMSWNTRIGDVIAHPSAPDTHYQCGLWSPVRGRPDRFQPSEVPLSVTDTAISVPEAAPDLLAPLSQVGQMVAARQSDYAPGGGEVVALTAWVARATPGRARVHLLALERLPDGRRFTSLSRSGQLTEARCRVSLSDNAFFQPNPYQIDFLGPLGDLQPGYQRALAALDEARQRREAEQARLAAERTRAIGIDADVLALLAAAGGRTASAPAQRRNRE